MTINSNTRYDLRINDEQRTLLMRALDVCLNTRNAPDASCDYFEMHDMLKAAIVNDAPDNTLNDFTA